MFLYNKNLKEGKFFVSMPSKIRYNFTFLNSITGLMKEVELSQCDQIYFLRISKANVPTTISSSPVPDFNDSFSWNTIYENAMGLSPTTKISNYSPAGKGGLPTRVLVGEFDCFEDASAYFAKTFLTQIGRAHV